MGGPAYFEQKELDEKERMQVAAVHTDEARRLDALRAHQVIDSEPELAFDRLTAMACRICSVPMAMVSLVDEHRQWAKARSGTLPREFPRVRSFCAHAILQDSPFVVLDTLADPRFADHPLVTGEPHVRFYAAAPLVTAEGHNIGTFAILDTRPREPGPGELENLRDLARIAVDELELRSISRSLAQRSLELANQTSILGSVLASAGEGIVVADENANIVLVNPAAEALAGISQARGRVSFPLATRACRADQITLLSHDELPLVQAVRGIATDKVEIYVRNAALPQGAFLSVTGRPIRDPEGRVRGGVITFNDVTEVKRAKEKLEQLASTDPLTGLANQRALRERLSLLVAEGARGRRFAVVMADIDHFKRINDNLGHLCGDEVIRRVAQALRGRIRTTDLVARYGGEEFCILLTDVDPEAAPHVADELRKVVASVDLPVPVTASFGVCAYSVRHASVDALLDAADQALYRAKREGRNRVEVGGSANEPTNVAGDIALPRAASA
ncbi:MAG: diguanylate cyclase [Myxococcales bacterium]